MTRCRVPPFGSDEGCDIEAEVVDYLVTSIAGHSFTFVLAKQRNSVLYRIYEYVTGKELAHIVVSAPDLAAKGSRAVMLARIATVVDKWGAETVRDDILRHQDLNLEPLNEDDF